MKILIRIDNKKKHIHHQMSNPSRASTRSTKYSGSRSNSRRNTLTSWSRARSFEFQSRSPVIPAGQRVVPEIHENSPLALATPGSLPTHYGHLAEYKRNNPGVDNQCTRSGSSAVWEYMATPGIRKVSVVDAIGLPPDIPDNLQSTALRRVEDPWSFTLFEDEFIDRIRDLCEDYAYDLLPFRLLRDALVSRIRERNEMEVINDIAIERAIRNMADEGRVNAIQSARQFIQSLHPPGGELYTSLVRIVTGSWPDHLRGVSVRDAAVIFAARAIVSLSHGRFGRAGRHLLMYVAARDYALDGSGNVDDDEVFVINPC